MDQAELVIGGLVAAGGEAADISPRLTRKIKYSCARNHDRESILIERLFWHLKDFRGIATRRSSELLVDAWRKERVRACRLAIST